MLVVFIMGLSETLREELKSLGWTSECYDCYFSGFYKGAFGNRVDVGEGEKVNYIKSYLSDLTRVSEGVREVEVWDRKLVEDTLDGCRSLDDYQVAYVFLINSNNDVKG